MAATGWNRKFAPPLALSDGRAIATLGQARVFILSLPAERQQIRPWRYASALLVDAAERKGSVSNARLQMAIALKAEGLIDQAGPPWL